MLSSKPAGVLLERAWAERPGLGLMVSNAGSKALGGRDLEADLWCTHGGNDLMVVLLAQCSDVARAPDVRHYLAVATPLWRLVITKLRKPRARIESEFRLLDLIELFHEPE